MTVALLLDVSGSVERVLGAEKAAANRFFAEVIRPGDQALLAGFAQLIAIWQDLTPSSADLQTALEKAGPFHATAYQTLATRPRGGTLLYDAIALVADQKLHKLPGRKTMVVITDGLDNGSIATLGKALKAALEADAVIYAIHYEDEAASATRTTKPSRRCRGAGRRRRPGIYPRGEVELAAQGNRRHPPRRNDLLRGRHRAHDIPSPDR